MAGFNLLDFLFGPAAQAKSTQSIMARPFTTVAPQLADPIDDQVRSDPGNPPYKSPDDLDNFGRETDEMRDAYLEFYRKEPAAKAAVRGKANSIACLDVTVTPADKSRPDDVAAAEFVDWTIRSSPHGWDGLVRNCLLPAFLQGYSVQEIVLRYVDKRESPRWGGKWGLKYCKSKDTRNLRLQVDAHRNVLGVVNVVQAIATYPRRKFVLFTHDELFDSPFGGSDLRAAYRSCQLIDEAYKLWYYAEKVYGGPIVKGKYTQQSTRKALEDALQRLRQGGWITMPATDDVEILNLAASINPEGKSRLIDKLREDIFLAVRGAFTPFMPGGAGGEVRGNTAVNKQTATDPDEFLLGEQVMRRINHDLIPALVTRNFPPGTGMPVAGIGGTNDAEVAAQLDLVDKAVKIGVPVSKKFVYQFTNFPPPVDANDALGGPPPALPGMPGDPAALPPSGDPAQPPAPPEPPPPPGQGPLGPLPPDLQFSDKARADWGDPAAFAAYLDDLLTGGVR